MSATELLVIVFGLFIGYWIVSKFTGGEPSRGQPRQRPAPGCEQSQPHAKEPDDPSESEARPAPWPEILKVSPDADVQEIRRAYKNLISQYHPDKVAALGPELREICERKSKDINTAFDQAMKERGVAA